MFERRLDIAQTAAISLVTRAICFVKCVKLHCNVVDQ